MRGAGFGGIALHRIGATANPLALQHTPIVPLPIATVGVELLKAPSDLFHQFICREICGISTDRTFAVISHVFCQSTSLTSTPPFRPCTSWNINKSPSLWYFVTSYRRFDFSTRIVKRSVVWGSLGGRSLTCMVPRVPIVAIGGFTVVSLVVSAVFSTANCIAFARGTALYELGRVDEAYGGRSG